MMAKPNGKTAKEILAEGNLANRPLDAEASLVAREMISKFVAHARSTGDEPKLAIALHTHGHACLLAGERDDAEKAFDESREISLRLGDKRSAAITFAMLGYIDLVKGRLEDGLPKIIAALGEIEAADGARAAILARLGEVSKKFEKTRFDAALKAASRTRSPEVQAELAKAIETARKVN
jgi:hypothetical protein